MKKEPTVVLTFTEDAKLKYPTEGGQMMNVVIPSGTKIELPLRRVFEEFR